MIDGLVKTPTGLVHISDLASDVADIAQYDPDNQITFFTRARVSIGATVGSLALVKFSNGFELKCTPDQRVMLIDGSYQYIAYLNEFDKVKDPKDGSTYTMVSREYVELDEFKDVYDVLDVIPFHNFIVASDIASIVCHNTNTASKQLKLFD